MESKSTLMITSSESPHYLEHSFQKPVLHIPLEEFSTTQDGIFPLSSSEKPNYHIEPATPDFSSNKARDLQIPEFSKVEWYEEIEDEKNLLKKLSNIKKTNSNPDSSNNSLKSISSITNLPKFKRSQTTDVNTLSSLSSNDDDGVLDQKRKSKEEKRKEVMEILELSRQNNKRKGNDVEMGIFGTFKLKELRQYLDSH